VDAVQWFPMEVIEQWINNRPEDFASGLIECWKAFRQQAS
jgi:hypothetical protein